MKNLKLVILLIIIFVLGLSGIYYIYDLNINKKAKNSATPTPTPQQNFPTASPTPTPSGAVSRANNLTSQPATGNDEFSPAEDLTVTRPTESQTISSPVKVSGFVKNSENATISIKDSNGSILTSEDFTCGSDNACYFETALEFSQTSTQKGFIELSTVTSTKSISINF